MGPWTPISRKDFAMPVWRMAFKAQSLPAPFRFYRLAALVFGMLIGWTYDMEKAVG